MFPLISFVVVIIICFCLFVGNKYKKIYLINKHKTIKIYIYFFLSTISASYPKNKNIFLILERFPLLLSSIDLIVRCSTSGDFRAAMEGLTIVEQCDTIENEQALLDSIFSLRSALNNKEKSDCHSLYAPMLKKLEHLERNQ